MVDNIVFMQGQLVSVDRFTLETVSKLADEILPLKVEWCSQPQQHAMLAL